MRIAPQPEEGELLNRGVRARQLLRVDVLAVRGFAQYQGRHIRIEIQAVRERVVTIATENTPGEERVTDDAHRPHRVSPAATNTLVIAQAPPLILGVVMIDENRYVVQVVARQIVEQLALG